MHPPPVEVTRHDGVLRLVLARPEKKNALNAAMYAALSEAIEGAQGADGPAVIRLTGQPGIFCAGNDLGEFLAAGERGLPQAVLRFLRALATSDVPLVVGVDGAAIGVGTTLLLHADGVIATPRSRFQTPFVPLGLVPEAASSLLAPARMGHQRAFALLAMGESFSAEEALAAGLLRAVVPEDRLDEALDAICARLAALPREALRQSRRLLRGDPAPVLARIDAEASLFADRLTSPEARAAFASFFNRPGGA